MKRKIKSIIIGEYLNKLSKTKSIIKFMHLKIIFKYFIKYYSRYLNFFHLVYYFENIGNSIHLFEQFYIEFFEDLNY